MMKALKITSCLFFYFSIIFFFCSCEKEEIDLNIDFISSENFKINSSDWPEYSTCFYWNDQYFEDVVYKLYSPYQNDYVIIEFVSGVPDNIVGEQLFSYSAACHEVGDVGRQMPTSYDWDNYLESIFEKKLNNFGGLMDVDVNKITNGVNPGYVAIQIVNGQLNIEEIHFINHLRGCAFWSGNGGTLSVDILDKDISRNNFVNNSPVHSQIFLLSIRLRN